MPLDGDEPTYDAARYEAFITSERARTAAEQERRKQSLSQRVTAEDLVEVEQQQIAEQPEDDAPFDPWTNLLATVETRKGVKRVYDSDGNVELRVTSRYILESVIGVAPERVNYSYASIRLGKLMRRLGWTGPKTMRMYRPGEEKVRGYCKAEVKEEAA